MGGKGKLILRVERGGAESRQASQNRILKVPQDIVIHQIDWLSVGRKIPK
jgi:hypothetical protein